MTPSCEAGRWITDGGISEIVRVGGLLLVELPERCADGAEDLIAELTAECNDLLAAQDRGTAALPGGGRPG